MRYVEVLYNYSKWYLLSDSPTKEMGPHRETEKIYDPDGIQTHNYRNRSPLL